MSTLVKDTARLLAKVISNGLSTCYSDDLVAILGVGRESTNEEAVQSWLIARFTTTDIGPTETFMEHASEVLMRHLNDVRLEVAVGGISELPRQQGLVPAKVLTDRELRCIARAIYLLILGEGTKPYLDALIELVLDSDGNPIDRIAAWVLSQTQAYTYFPSELTLPLAQRLMQKLKLASETF